MPTLLTYIDKLQKANADDLAFYPLTTLEKAIESGHILVAYENDEPCGYLWFGAVRAGYPVVIYQACIDYDVRRRDKGFSLVRELLALGLAGGANAVRLKCASSADSNVFWETIGFTCQNVTAGGVKRSRDINHWYTPISPSLFTLEAVTPSSRPIDLRSYQKAKREGVVMPNPWSRTHY